MADEPLPHHRALAGQHLEQIRRAARPRRPSSASRMVVSGVISAGLTSTALPAASAGTKPHDAIGHREVPRRDDADHAERLVERDVQSAGDRNLLAGQAFRAGRVELQHVADVAGLPLGVADHVPGVGHLQRGQLVRRGHRPPPRTPATRPARSAGASCGPLLLRGLRAGDRVVDAGGTSSSSTVRSTSSVAGLISVDVLTRLLPVASLLPPSFRCVFRRRLDDPGEQPQVVEPFLGMPLHRQRRKLSPGQSRPPRHAVRVPRAGDQTLAELGDGLVVIALRVGGLTDQRGQPGAGHRADRRCAEHGVARLVLVVADDVGQVLVQRAAERDVENLRAAADAEHGQPARQSAPRTSANSQASRSRRGLVGARVRRLPVAWRGRRPAAGDAPGRPVRRARGRRCRRRRAAAAAAPRCRPPA